MAPGGPAAATGHPACMAAGANGDLPGRQGGIRLRRLPLEMAFQTERGVALEQHALVDSPVRVMAGGATVAHGLVAEHIRALLHRVALVADVILAHQGGAAAFFRISLVRIMAVNAAYPPLKHRMGVRQVEFRAHLQVALKAGFRRFAGIDDRVSSAARLDVLASGSVTRLTTDILGVFALSFQA